MNEELSIDKKTMLAYLKENQQLIQEINFLDCVEEPDDEHMVRISYVGELLERKYKVNDYVFQTNRHLFQDPEVRNALEKVRIAMTETSDYY
jgi:hypothetical protein